ncbi:MAG: flagellar basal-body rod protein FlgF [Succinivibrio dextrinosolvens]|jgi:flagellar basal-body rod protein FlgF|uniref:flagellar basal-body rod protein FlgF n=1 Tax=Succinivibrio sp. TaxID=2053619 RepID=UPI0025E2DD11|nr:flagellar basal-body rod protein FlgF [uncultured Succinivibrio sp.]MBQ3884005.1 flagellar basal-body rod protein FlgF [Succinivibrio sp.]MDY6465490.1 flagellar basal-body rod protein FlgF [Succinivibrio dextrinosolvens]
MDKLLWVAMSGAKENFHSLAVRSNNLANSATTGFKADFENSRAMSVFADAYPTRAFAMTERPGYNMQGGAIETTDRELDIAIDGDGFIAVNDKSGSEAYTRYGSMEIDVEGNLRTSNGLNVLNEDGEPIVLPLMLADINISKDGVISGRPQGGDSNVIEEYARIKLVRPESYKDIEKGYDGLFRRIDGTPLAQENTVRVRNGMLEQSNVNPVEELTNLIRIQRQYDATVKLMETANQMDERQNTLLTYE